MAQGDTKVFNGQLYYEDNGQWIPYKIASYGSGGGRGKQGPRGPAGPSGGGDTIESGTFTRTAAAGSGIQNIVTTKKAKLIFFIATPDTFASGSSNGKDDSINASNTTFQDANTGTVAGDLLNSINVSGAIGGNGYTAKVTTINNNSYDVTWLQIGAGTDVTVQWHAITG